MYLPCQKNDLYLSVTLVDCMQQFWFTAAVFFLFFFTYLSGQLRISAGLFFFFFHVLQRPIAEDCGSFCGFFLRILAANWGGLRQFFAFFFVCGFFLRILAANWGGLRQFLRVFFTYLSGQLGRIVAVLACVVYNTTNYIAVSSSLIYCFLLITMTSLYFFRS